MKKIYIILGVIALALSVEGLIILSHVGSDNQSGLKVDCTALSNCLGAGTRFPNGISADTTSPTAGQVRGTTLTITGAGTIGSTLGITGAATLSSSLTTLGTFTEGGGVRATSTDDTSATLLATDFDVENIINFTPNVTGITLTSPASSTLTSFIGTAGQSRRVLLCNATTTAGEYFTFAAGTGNNLHQATSSMSVLYGTCVRLEFYRNSDTDIELYYGSGY